MSKLVKELEQLRVAGAAPTGARDRVWGNRKPKYKLHVKRPYGARASVIDWVIDESQRQGISASRRMVEQCWKDYSATQAAFAGFAKELGI
jgi:hypothetical protein